MADGAVDESEPVGELTPAYQACLPEMMSLHRAEIQTVNLDVMLATGTVHALRERLDGLRSRAAALNDFDARAWDMLQTYGYALMQAHLIWQSALGPRSDLNQLLAAARSHFEQLRSVVQMLVKRGLFSPRSLKQVAKQRGWKRYAYGLLGLVNVLREAWPKLGNKTGLTEDDLLHAELAGERLARCIPIEPVKDLRETRDRAFTLFMRAYGQVRRVVQYLLRDKRAVDKYAPSLYRRRHVRKAKAQVQAGVLGGEALQAIECVPQRPEERAIGAHCEAARSNAPSATSGAEVPTAQQSLAYILQLIPINGPYAAADIGSGARIQANVNAAKVTAGCFSGPMGSGVTAEQQKSLIAKVAPREQ